MHTGPGVVCSSVSCSVINSRSSDVDTVGYGFFLVSLNFVFVPSCPRCYFVVLEGGTDKE